MSKYINVDTLNKELYHAAFESDTDMQRWDSGCWIRYKLFEDVLNKQPKLNIKSDELDLILSALEEKRIEYGKFYKDAQKMGQIPFMQRWEDKAKLCRDLIIKVYMAKKLSEEVDQD